MENLQKWIKDYAIYYKASCPTHSSLRIKRLPPPEIVLLKESIGTLIVDEHIDHFPNVICELTNLYNLEICNNNNINEIPKTIYKLKKLRELWLNSSLITFIPKSICKLRKLEVLCLSYCPIKELPPLLGKLQLRNLYMSKGGIIYDWLEIIFLIYKSYKTVTSCRTQYFLQPVNELL